ncbi:MAG: flagellar hook-associated protein FlgK, partial [Pseudomonadota bacterium]
GNRGGGVAVDAIIRNVDAGIVADRRLADAALGGETYLANTLTRLQQAVGGPDDAAGLPQRLAVFENALISASSDPASETRLANVVGTLQDVVDTLQANTRSIQDLRQEADSAIARDITVLNQAIVQVDGLNKDILRISSTGADPSALLDARQKAIDTIAEIVPVRETLRDNGAVTLRTVNGTTLLDGRPRQFGFERTPTITGDMSLAAGSLNGITLDGVPLDPATGVGRLDGGSLGAAFAMRDKTLVEVQAGLDGMAADLIARFQDPANDPTLNPGDVGLLTDELGPLDLADIPGLAGRITVNAAIVPSAGGDLTLLRDGLNSTVPGPSGDATQLNRWIDALAAARADVPGSPAQSAAGRAASFTAEIAANRVAADEQLGFTTARWNTLTEAELADGVDTDFELQNLLRIEQAYAANARVIQAIDVMLRSLTEI